MSRLNFTREDQAQRILDDLYANQAAPIGDVVLVGIPGEPFTDVGVGIKEAEGWDLILPCCITNGYEGYFPTMEAYLEGGYEARSSIFKAGIAEAVSGAGLEMLETIRKNKGGC